MSHAHSVAGRWIGVSGAAAALWLVGCAPRPGAESASTQTPANLTVFFYNSSGRALEVSIPELTTKVQNEVLDFSFMLSAGARKRVRAAHAGNWTIVVAGAAGAESLGQTLAIPPAGQERGDLLVDLGGRGVFYQHPLVFVPPSAARDAGVVVELQRRFPTQKLDGPRAVYALDFRAIGLNKGLSPQKLSSLAPDTAEVSYTILTERVWQDLQRGVPLDYVERHDD